MNNVGIDAVRQGYAGDRCAADLALRHDLGFEFWAVVTPLGALGDRLVRHDVHDFHRAHDARSVRLSQDGIAGRIHITCVMKRGLVGYGVARLAEKFDTVIVDAGGQDSVELRQAIAVCDYLLIPVRPSQWDVWSLNNMAALVDEVASKTGEKINAHVVLNACSTNRSVKEADEVRSLIVTEYAAQFDVLRCQVCDRIAVRRAARDGLCVSELDKSSADSKAQDELEQIYQEVFDEHWSATHR